MDKNAAIMAAASWINTLVDERRTISMDCYKVIDVTPSPCPLPEDPHNFGVLVHLVSVDDVLRGETFWFDDFMQLQACE